LLSHILAVYIIRYAAKGSKGGFAEHYTSPMA
jgi:hypothetical protein